MKKNKLITVIALAAIIISSGCSKKFEEITNNPNQPVSVPAYLLLRQIENDLALSPNVGDKICQHVLSSYTYYGDNQYWTGETSLNYGTLNNVIAMEKEAAKSSGDENPYAALAKFFKAYLFIDMSLRVGDLPMTEALLGLENPTPKYDTQKDIFKQSLQLLEDANTQLASLISSSNTSILGDFYFQERISNGKDALTTLKQWQKVVNTYKLRVLIELSKKEDDGDLNIKQKFSDVVSNSSKYPIMTDLSDNWEYVYNSNYNYYPNNKSNFGFDALRICVAATWLNNLASLHDLRAMKVAEPARGQGYEDTDYRSFVGGPNGLDMSSLGEGVQTNSTFSCVGRKRYYDGFTGENTFIVGYPEMCLNIAEAINRGWLSGDADSWYQKGVKAMFAFYGVNDGANTVSFLRTNAPGDYISYDIDFSYDDYFAQPAVQYAGDNEEGLQQILLQRYLALARNSGLEGYYQWRRTGVPEFSVGSGTGNSGVIPLRFQYPASELATNSANYKAAVQSQYSGSDNINSKMWIIQ